MKTHTNKTNTFICSFCKEKSDDPEEYTYLIHLLANPEEPNKDFWICIECHLDGIHEKQIEPALL